MKKIYCTILAFFISLIIGCNKQSSKPVISIPEYSQQLVVMNGVIDKLLNEQDPKKMYAIADAIESSRAVNCIPVENECNSYYKLINKVVNYTKEGHITNDQRMELFKMQTEFQEEVRKGEVKIREIWKENIQKNSNEINEKTPSPTQSKINH